MIALALSLGLLLQVQAPLAVRPDTQKTVHDALHYDITVVLDDSSTYVLGEVATTWRIRDTTPIVMQLDSVFRVVKVSLNGKADTRGSRTLWGRPPGVLVIPHTFAIGDTVTTRVRYRGKAVDGLIIGKNVHGVHTAFADNWPDRGRHWFPSQDYPGDKASVALHVQVPFGYSVIANGTLTKVDTLPHGSHVWSYKLDEQIPTYTMVLGAAPFAVTKLAPAQCAVKCVPVEVWSFREDSAYAAEAFAPASAIIEYLATLAGPFPYPQLRHVQSSTRFGGMENASAIFYDEKLYPARRMTDDLIAHETAHQWFGDAVTEADWHHVWLSEGFATYMAALWTRRAHGDSAFRATMANAADKVRNGKVADRPIIDPPATDLLGFLNTNAYQKGSWVLHSLRGVIGDSAFVRGLQVYTTRFRDGNALSSDLELIMEQTSRQKLDWFFTQELTQARWAELDVQWHWEKGRLTLVIEQPNAKMWGTYQLPKLGIDVDGVRQSVDVRGPETRVDFPVAKRPTRLTVDPDAWWLLTAVVHEQ